MILFLNRDLFAGIRVANALRARGDRVELVSTAAGFATRLAAEGSTVRLGLIDMGAVDDWTPLAALSADGTSVVPTLAFGPHKDVEAFRAAREAGITRVVSNGAFHADTLGLIDRYARQT